MTTQTPSSHGHLTDNTAENHALNWLAGVGAAVIIAILVGGALSYNSDDETLMREGLYWGLYALLGGLYLAGFLRWDDYTHLLTNSIALSGLTALGVICMVLADFHGPIWFLLMPVTMQAPFFLSRRMTVLYAVGVVLLINTLAYVLAASTVAVTFSLWLSNTVTIGGMYAVGIVIQIGLIEQFRARAEVERLNAQLRNYAAQSAVLAASQERNRMAHTIHDSLGHALTVVSVQLEAAEHLLERGQVDQAMTAIRNARQVNRQGLDDVRSSVHTLRSDTAADRPALSMMLQALTEYTKSDGRSVTFHSDPAASKTLDALSPASGDVLLRTIQEGLTNALKHADPTCITLTVEAVPDVLRLTLTNDAPRSTPGPGTRSGLSSLRNQITLLGGTLTTDAYPDHFTLIAEVPHHDR